MLRAFLVCISDRRIFCYGLLENRAVEQTDEKNEARVLVGVKKAHCEGKRLTSKERPNSLRRKKAHIERATQMLQIYLAALPYLF